MWHLFLLDAPKTSSIHPTALTQALLHSETVQKGFGFKYWLASSVCSVCMILIVLNRQTPNLLASSLLLHYVCMARTMLINTN